MNRRRATGVTLIELMVVMSIIAVLLGVGMAMMSESNKDMGLRAARGSVLGMCRFARTAARNTRAPVSIRIDPGGKFLTTVVRRPMGAWHFEEDSLVGALGHTATLAGGKLTDDGRIGRAVAFSDSGGNIDCGNVAMYSTDQGLIVEIWYRPKLHKKDRVLVQKSGEFGLAISRFGYVQGFVGVEAQRVSIAMTDAPLPEGRWSKVSLLWDGTGLTLAVNDHPLARKTGKATFAMGDAPVMIGTKEFPLDGWVDELRVDALLEDSRTVLRDNLTVSGPAEIRWDETGALDATLHTGPATITIKSPIDSTGVTINLLGGSQ
ncbi:MAG: prepilin-type N-terminal cleavage/methylation domain-containing protein [Planctomycetes bacterium]|nr:prepilin-type N-terminal cleavage/methylation domain-containing protein [Planctomycetota bacterium]